MKQLFTIILACFALAAQGKPNVILISADTLRADALGCYGQRLDLTPNLDLLAAENIRAEYCVATCHWTKPTHCSMFTGSYPSRHGCGPVDSLASVNYTMAEILKDHGYATGASVGGTNVSSEWNMHQGFDFWVEADLAPFKPDLYKVRQEAYKWIKAHKEKPFFFFVHTFEPHACYNAPEPWFEMYCEPEYAGPVKLGYPKEDFNESWRKDNKVFVGETVTRDPNPTLDDIEYLRGRYYGEVKFVDSFLIGGMVQFLKEERLWENTLLIFVSDHGENFGERNLFDHHQHLHAELTNVPLIIKLPGEREPATIQEAVSQTDILPTVLDVLGIRSSLEFDGVSIIRPLPKERIVLTETIYYKGATSRRWKALHHHPKDIWSFYNLLDDPSENNPMNDCPNAEQLKMAIQHYAFRNPSKWNSEIEAREPDEISEGMLQRLRDMGYISN